MPFFRRGVALCAATASLACGSVAHAQSSSFAQLTGRAGCVLQVVPYFYDGDPLQGCAGGRALFQAEAVALSPDQKHVYVAASGTLHGGSNAVVVFSRDPAGTGELTSIGCVSDDAGDGRPGTDGVCADGDALLGANDVAITPDGRHVYVSTSSSHGLASFARDDETGKLTQVGCHKEIPRRDRCVATTGLMGANAVAVSPDGRNVYVTASGSNALGVFARDAETGALTQTQCVSNNGSDGLCVDGVALEGASAVAVAPDGRTVYVTGGGIGSLLTFARDPDTGLLTQKSCLLDEPVDGSVCGRGETLAGAGAIAIGGDGRDVYVGGQYESAITLFRRGDDGSLAVAGCWAHAEPEGDDRMYKDDDPDEVEEEDEEEEDWEDEEEDDWEDEDLDAEAAQAGKCAPVKALGSIRELALTPDGRSLVAAGYGSLAALERDPATGALRQTGCAEAYRTYKSCAEGRALSGASGVAVTDDGRNMYVASRSASGVAVFGAAVAVATPAATVSRAGVARVRLSCPPTRTSVCAGRLSLRGVRDRRARAASGQPRFRLAPGRSTKVTLRLPLSLRRVLRRHDGARVTLLASDARGVTRATRRRVLLRR